MVGPEVVLKLIVSRSNRHKRERTSNYSIMIPSPFLFPFKGPVEREFGKEMEEEIISESPAVTDHETKTAAGRY